MTDLYGGGRATSSEELTALVLEARRQGVSYGRLVANTDQYDLKKLIRAYCAKKKRKGKNMRMYKTGDPCPCCGQPIPYRDPECLRLFSILMHLLDIGPDDEAELDSGDVSDSDTSGGAADHDTV